MQKSVERPAKTGAQPDNPFWIYFHPLAAVLALCVKTVDASTGCGVECRGFTSLHFTSLTHTTRPGELDFCLFFLGKRNLILYSLVY